MILRTVDVLVWSVNMNAAMKGRGSQQINSNNTCADLQQYVRKELQQYNVLINVNVV